MPVIERNIVLRYWSCTCCTATHRKKECIYGRQQAASVLSQKFIEQVYGFRYARL
jgi:hypothetical protein